LNRRSFAARVVLAAGTFCRALSAKIDALVIPSGVVESYRLPTIQRLVSRQ
jgi:hypothetical protein